MIGKDQFTIFIGSCFLAFALILLASQCATRTYAHAQRSLRIKSTAFRFRALEILPMIPVNCQGLSSLSKQRQQSSHGNASVLCDVPHDIDAILIAQHRNT
jgi:hypothetical protein